MEPESIYVGIDVAKERVDVAVRPSGEIWSEDYDEPGIERLAARLQALGPVAVVLEATGGLEVPLASALAAAALPVAVVNPRQVRDFAKATGRLAKTDALDAQVLAHFAQAVRPPVRQLPDDAAQELSAMTTRRNQVMTMLVAEKNRLSRSIPAVRPSIQAHIAWLEQELKNLDDGLRQTLRRSPVWREKDDLLRSVPGVGEQLSLSLLAYLPELGTLNRKQVAALVGVAPINPGQRDQAGPQGCVGRPGSGQDGSLHGSPGGQPAQSGDTGVLPADAGGREVQEGGPYRVHAQASGHPQRHGQEWRALESPAPRCLTSETVALVYWACKNAETFKSGLPRTLVSWGKTCS